MTGCSGSAVSSSGSPETTTAAKGPTTTIAAQLLDCYKYNASQVVGTIQDPELDELSGLAMSTHKGMVWTHNDSGDTSRIFAITTAGKILTTVNIENAGAFDYEDIALSPVDHQIWVADIGDNLHIRPNIQLYHFPEPDTSSSEVSVKATRVNVHFEGGDSHPDAESFFIDRDGNGYIVEKTFDQRLTWVYEIPATEMSRPTATAKAILQITGNSNGNGYGPTAADLSADGTTLVIKNYSETFEWRFKAGSSIPDVLAKRPTSNCVIKAGAGEGITFDGTDLLTVEEGVGKPLKRTKVAN